MNARTHAKAIEREAGFTLIEFLVTLVIVAMVVGTVGSTLARRDARVSLHEAGQTMQSILLRARSDAILKNRDTMFAINTDGKRYSYPDGTTYELPKGFEMRLTAGGEFVSEDRSTYFLIFRADGSSSGAQIVLTDGTPQGVRVDVNWLTGIPRLTSGTVL